jgi:hypothetical protein
LSVGAPGVGTAVGDGVRAGRDAVGPGVGVMVGATESAGAGELPESVGAVDGASVGARLATATAGGVGATGTWSPPRAATKLIAVTAQHAVKSADARTAGVRVRRPGARLEPSTPLLLCWAGRGL